MHVERLLRRKGSPHKDRDDEQALDGLVFPESAGHFPLKAQICGDRDSTSVVRVLNG